MKNDWRIEIEGRFEKYASLVYDNKIKTILLILLLSIGVATQLPKITFDTSTEGFLYKSDPMILDYNSFREQFGKDEKIIISIKSKNIFTREFLEKLTNLHEELKRSLPYVKEVDSLINARKTIGNKDELIVDDLFKEGIPTTQIQIDEINEFILNNPIYKNLYISEDGTFTTILITTQTYEIDMDAPSGDEFSEFSDFNTTEPKEDTRTFLSVKKTNELIAKVEEIVTQYQDENFKMNIAGSPIVTKNLQESLIADMSKFIFMVIGTIAVILFLMFRRISGVVVPLLVVVLTLISTISWMAIWGVPITSMTQILPSLLLAVGVAATVHLMAIFYQKFNESGDKKEAIIYAFGHSGLAIVMTSVTTAASLSSFAFSSIAPVAYLGLFASGGVLYSLLMTLVFVPAILSISPLKSKQNKIDENNFTIKIMDKITSFTIHNSKSILGVSIIIIVGSLYLSSLMQFSHNPLHWFKEGNIVRESTELIDKELKGSITIEVVLDTQRENGVYNPEFLNAIEKSSETISTFEDKNYFIGKIVTINDVLKEIHKALNENREEYYIIPQDYNTIAQEFLLFENSGSDDLESIVDSRFSKTRVSIKAPWVDSVEYVELIEKIRATYKANIKDMATITITGTLPILASTITKSIKSSIESYLYAFIVITVLMILLIGDIKLGLIAMIPNITPILFGVSIMVVYDLPLDMFTILIGAIAIGLVVDDTIHFMHNFKRYNLIHNDVNKAIRLTLRSTGSAIFVSSVVLSAGFFVFMFANMNNLFNFGLITGVTIMVAMFSNLILAPALMKLVVKNR